MRKTFKIIGLIGLTVFSFFITDKTVTVVNNMDEIMIEIKEKKDQYKTNFKNAIVDENTIIPGICGRKVNINKSYKSMKRNGYFSEKFFVYDYIKPKISLLDNMDKYIIKGNPEKRMISLIFNLKNDEEILDILATINNYGLTSTFFVDYNWFSNNINLIKDIIEEGHNVYPFLEDYTDSNYEWMDMVIKKINKQSIGFCYSKEDNQSNLDSCALRGNYTIRPIEISDKTPLVDIKNKIEPGSLFVLKNNSELKKELSTIIIYIKSKGYKIVNLEEHIFE